jgi:hypothetical protein
MLHTVFTLQQMCQQVPKQVQLTTDSMCRFLGISDFLLLLLLLLLLLPAGVHPRL